MNWSQPKVYAVKHKDEEIRAGKDVCKGFENQRYLVWYDLP